jgi:hypothetical protein
MQPHMRAGFILLILSILSKPTRSYRWIAPCLRAPVVAFRSGLLL